MCAVGCVGGLCVCQAVERMIADAILEANHVLRLQDAVHNLPQFCKVEQPRQPAWRTAWHTAWQTAWCTAWLCSLPFSIPFRCALALFADAFPLSFSLVGFSLLLCHSLGLSACAPAGRHHPAPDPALRRPLAGRVQSHHQKNREERPLQGEPPSLFFSSSCV